MQVAPGTYNHSILLGNLAEAAAEAIGADPLLARVGAYYHDIGKVVRPEYFVENQLHVPNPHDRLSPGLSKLAITAHVRDGEDLARQYNLPRADHRHHQAAPRHIGADVLLSQGQGDLRRT